MAKCMLTTHDNPYDPFTQYEAWYHFDEGKGYHSCAYLARIARTSDRLSEEENDQEIERAINDIIKYDVLGIYKKVNSQKQKKLAKLFLIDGDPLWTARDFWSPRQT